MTTQEVIQRLKDGNDRFVAGPVKPDNQSLARREDLTVNGQHPYAIILSCADSRVAPELTFDAGLGELFVIRIAGNVATPAAIASIEYAVAHLNTKVIVVLGHQNCGAVGAALAGGSNSYNIDQLLSFIAPAIAATPEGQASTDPHQSHTNQVVRKNAVMTVGTLAAQSNILSAALEDGLQIVPAYYRLDTGKVDFIGQEA